MSLVEILSKLHNSDEYPLHMPGGKRDYSPEELLSEAYGLDITEIDGYDNLYDAQGILKDALNRAATLYKCPDTYYLVNGSTVGVIIAIYAATCQGDHIIIARNCHRSVYSAIELRGLTADIITGKKLLCEDIDGGITPASVEEALKASLAGGVKPAAVVITSPNYDGVISDVEGIVKVAHALNIPVIVDEAHGAHLSLHEELPEGAIDAGADIVIHSSHKTLAAMTQTALLHTQGNLVDKLNIEKYWHTFQTSSPSYVLMSSIDAAVCDLMQNGDRLWREFLLNRRRFFEDTGNLKALHILTEEDVKDREDIKALDVCKITVVTDGRISGYELQEILIKDYHIRLELASEHRIIAIITYADTKEGFARFAAALREIDNKIVSGIVEKSQPVTQALGADDSSRVLYAPCIPSQV